MPAGYIAAEFIFVNHKDSNVPIFKVSTDTPEAKLEAVVNVQPDFPDVMNFLTSDTHQFGIALVSIHEGKRIRWEYGGIFESVGSLEYNRKYKIKKVGRFNFVDGELIHTNSKTEITSTQYVKIANSHNPCFYLYSLKSDNTKDEKHEYIPALTPDGSPSLYDKVTQTTHVLTFPIGFTLSQARKLDKLPATGGSLTVSLPWEAQLIASGIPAILQAAADKGWTITVQYREPEANNEYYNRYAECVTVADMAAVNPNFRTDLTVDGGWIYPLPELTNLANMAWGGTYTPHMPIKYLDCDAPKVTKTNPGFVHGAQPVWARGDWSGVETGTWMFGAGWDGKLVNVEMVFPKLKDGSNMFTGAILNKESVLRILDSIPSMLDISGFHRMDIGIHIDHQTDEEVATAIANAEAKGWTLTVQWNGTATAQTASTFGLRKPPIYAKVGSMVLPDGTTEQYLDWGHYVTNWEENGYQEFASVEEAKEHFNISE